MICLLGLGFANEGDVEAYYGGDGIMVEQEGD